MFKKMLFIVIMCISILACLLLVMILFDVIQQLAMQANVPITNDVITIDDLLKIFE